MKILNLVQGTREWLDVRLSHFTASEAPMMMNESKYFTRNQLLDHKKGWITSVDEFTQKLFDKGHAAEASARTFIEMDEFQNFSPLVVSNEIEGLPLLASLDGQREDNLLNWEHKLFNKTLAENVANNILEPSHYWQLEHQALVSEVDDVLFTVSDGTEENRVSMIYTSQPERRQELLAGWKQFAKDLADHEVKAKEEKLVANEIAELPKLEVSLVGNVSNSNLVEYKGTALTFIKSINTELATDQDFVDAEKAVKWCQKGETELDNVKEKALSDTADIKTLFDTIDELKEEMRQKRLTLSKLVKSRKEQIKSEIMQNSNSQISDMVKDLRAEFNGVPIDVKPDFVEAMKGKRTIESLQNAVDSELARCKIELTEKATGIRANIKTLHELGSNHQFLFSDWMTLVSSKENDDLTNLIKSRIAEHEQAEAAHKKAEQERIELAAKEKAEREAAAQIALKEHNIREEERAKVEAEQEIIRAQFEAEQTANAKTFRESIAAHEPVEKEQPIATPVAERLAQVFETAEPIKTVKTPTARDISIFLQTLNDDSLNDFGYLLLSSDINHQQEALAKIRNSFSLFLDDLAA